MLLLKPKLKTYKFCPVTIMDRTTFENMDKQEVEAESEFLAMQKLAEQIWESSGWRTMASCLNHIRSTCMTQSLCPTCGRYQPCGCP